MPTTIGGSFIFYVVRSTQHRTLWDICQPTTSDNTPIMTKKKETVKSSDSGRNWSASEIFTYCLQRHFITGVVLASGDYTAQWKQMSK